MSERGSWSSEQPGVQNLPKDSTEARPAGDAVLEVDIPAYIDQGLAVTVPKVGVVSISDVWKRGGRLDARYNLIANEFKEASAEILATLTTEQILDFAVSLPFSKKAYEAVNPVASGKSCSRDSFMRWIETRAKNLKRGTDKPGARRELMDVVVYCAFAAPSAVSKVLAEVEKRSRQNLAALTDLSRLLGGVVKRDSLLYRMMKGVSTEDIAALMEKVKKA